MPVAVFVVIIMAIPVVVMMMAVLATAIMAMNPMTVRFVPGHPDHFPIAVPIAVAVTVI
jgi:hypothetical protein